MEEEDSLTLSSLIEAIRNNEQGIADVIRAVVADKLSKDVVHDRRCECTWCR